MADRLSEIIRSGDTRAVLRAALGARAAADEGRFCECLEPSLHGRDLMCGNCLLENRQQRDRLAALIAGPHAFEPHRNPKLADKFCGVCARVKGDYRHQQDSGQGEGSDRG